jgi:hypothetical protein
VLKSGAYFASEWVGIDGCVDSKKLVQAGTTEQTVDGKVTYYAWTEIIPAKAVNADITIHPGDYITAEVQKYAGSNQWNLSVTDITTDVTSNRTVIYTTPEQSAEAVLERPTIDKQLSLLAPTSAVTFLSPAVPYQGNWVSLNSAIPDTKLLQLFMFSHSGGTGIASPSKIDSGGCFTVADGSKSPPSPTDMTCDDLQMRLRARLSELRPVLFCHEANPHGPGKLEVPRRRPRPRPPGRARRSPTASPAAPPISAVGAVPRA